MLHKLRLCLFISILTLPSLFANTGDGYGAEPASPQSENVSTQTQLFGEYLKVQEQLESRAFDSIDRASKQFNLLVGTFGTLVLAAAGGFAWFPTRWTKNEIDTQLKSTIAAKIESDVASTQRRLTAADNAIDDVHKQLSYTRTRALSVESALSEQQESINKLVMCTIGKYPYGYQVHI